ncbi:MAG TPA: hypothetical protein VJN18_25235 [Polyangiaceae bacterium]|nr:hypothetical protein [Polyangiaceae bacterium]
MTTARDDSDRAFEHLLLDSARADALSDTQKERAWQALSQALGSAALGGGSIAEGRRPSGPWHSAPLRWLVLGALGGAAVSALALWPAPISAPSPHFAIVAAGSGSVAPAQVASPPNASPTSAPSPPQVRHASSPLERRAAWPLGVLAPFWWGRHAPPPSAEVNSAEPPPTRPRSALLTRELRCQSKLSVALAAPSSRAAPRPAGLEQEIAALDAARTALRERAPARALGLLEDYAQTFPRGQLALEAEVVTIRALEMQGLWSEADRRASAYLTQHPDDPHAAGLRLRSEDAATP